MRDTSIKAVERSLCSAVLAIALHICFFLLTF
jgi:hypothetical protein